MRAALLRRRCHGLEIDARETARDEVTERRCSRPRSATSTTSTATAPARPSAATARWSSTSASSSRRDLRRLRPLPRRDRGCGGLDKSSRRRSSRASYASEQRFGVGHVVGVLRGVSNEKVRKAGHERLTTWGLLREISPDRLRNWIDQLIGAGALEQTTGRYPILRLNEMSWDVMRSRQDVVFLESSAEVERKPTRSENDSWEGVDRALFEEMRSARRDWARERGVPPYVILSDQTLREIARVRPTTRERLSAVKGIGQQKLSEWGTPLLDIVRRAAEDRGLSTDLGDAAGTVRRDRAPLRQNRARDEAYRMFRAGRPVDEVARATDRAPSTIHGYLESFIREETPASVEPWIDVSLLERVSAALHTSEDGRMRPIFDALGGDVPFEVIRIVKAFVETQSA